MIKNKQARGRQFGKFPRGAEGKEEKLVSFADDGAYHPAQISALWWDALRRLWYNRENILETLRFKSWSQEKEHGFSQQTNLWEQVLLIHSCPAHTLKAVSSWGRFGGSFSTVTGLQNELAKRNFLLFSMQGKRHKHINSLNRNALNVQNFPVVRV